MVTGVVDNTTKDSIFVSCFQNYNDMFRVRVLHQFALRNVDTGEVVKVLFDSTEKVREGNCFEGYRVRMKKILKLF